MRLKYYLSIVTLIWIYLLASAATSVYGAEKECDANICEEKNVGFICAPGSVIVIQEVMCRTRGSNCDLTAYQQVTRLCAGRQYCDSTDLLTVSDQYCERNDKKQFLSIVFVSYVCVEEKAIESECNDAGRGVSSDHRYLSSPGYPALVTGNSVCTWRLQPPPGLHTDIFIREYLHLDNTGQQLFSIREVATDSDVLNLEKTAKRDLTTTIGGDVEIALHTDESLHGHRVFIEYRYVKPPLEHLRPFPVPNKTECGESLVGKTFFPDNKDKTGIKKLPSTTTPSPTYTTPSQSTQTPTNGNKGVSTTTKAPAPPNVKETDVHEDDSSKTELIVAISVCAVGLACCVVAIWITCRHRKKKASMNKRNCLATDTYSVEYDRASLGTTPSAHPYSRPAPIVTTPGHQPYPVGRVDFIRQSETVQFKNGFHSPHEPIIEASPADETFTGPQRFDRNGDPLDLSKYLITGSENPTGSITSQTSSRSSNGHIYEAVREH